MLAEKTRRRTLAGYDIWIAQAAGLSVDREALAGLGLAELGLAPGGLQAGGLKLEGLCLGRTDLGQPVLLAANGRSLSCSVSFTSLGGQLWVAVSAAPGLGVDVTAAAEFAPPYPEDRVFAPGERLAALDLCPVAPADALSLLWSLKEAAAKALGTGFHRVEPIELIAAAFQPTPQGLVCEVRAPVMILPAIAERLPGGWLSVAVTGGSEPEHDGVE